MGNPNAFLHGATGINEFVLEEHRLTLWRIWNVDGPAVVYGDDRLVVVFDLEERLLHHMSADGQYYFAFEITSYRRQPCMAYGVAFTVTELHVRIDRELQLRVLAGGGDDPAGGRERFLQLARVCSKARAVLADMLGADEPAPEEN